MLAFRLGPVVLQHTIPLAVGGGIGDTQPNQDEDPDDPLGFGKMEEWEAEALTSWNNSKADDTCSLGAVCNRTADVVDTTSAQRSRPRTILELP